LPISEIAVLRELKNIGTFTFGASILSYYTIPRLVPKILENSTFVQNNDDDGMFVDMFAAAGAALCSGSCSESG
jgi:hypothetical protein